MPLNKRILTPLRANLYTGERPAAMHSNSEPRKLSLSTYLLLLTGFWLCC